MKNNFQPEDKLIEAFDKMRWMLVRVIIDIDKEIEYFDRVKKFRSKGLK